jgi:hypothetical protein
MNEMGLKIKLSIDSDSDSMILEIHVIQLIRSYYKCVDLQYDVFGCTSESDFSMN